MPHLEATDRLADSTSKITPTDSTITCCNCGRTLQEDRDSYITCATQALLRRACEGTLLMAK
jgi:hypothetical protein